MMKEKFLLDSNSFIEPYNNYYPFDFAPGYWKQLKPVLLKDNIAILDIIKAELYEGNDELTEWLNSIEGIQIIDRREQVILSKYSEVLSFLQNSPSYNDKALRAWSDAKKADPWLIAVASTKGYTLVTQEKSAGRITSPSSKAKIPDIAKEFGVKCVDLFYLIRQMKVVWK